MHRLSQNLFSRQNTVDISQDVILTRMQDYLRLVEHADKHFLEKLDEGHCFGFTILAGYGMYLSLTQRARKDGTGKRIPRDDWDTTEAALIRIAKSTEYTILNRSKTGRKLRQNFKRITSLIIGAQHHIGYLNQKEILKGFDDISGRSFVLEYKFAKKLKYEDFLRPLYVGESRRKTNLLDEVCRENCLTFLLSPEHIAVLIKHGKYYYFYDSNNKKGFLIAPINSPQMLIEEIFKMEDSAGKIEEVMDVFVLRDSTIPANIYPAETDLVKALDGESFCAEDDFVNFIEAIKIDSPELVKFYVENGRVNLKRCFLGYTAGHMAALHGSLDVLKLLISFDINVNILNSENKSMLYLASLEPPCRAMISYLLNCPGIRIGLEECVALWPLIMQDPEAPYLRRKQLRQAALNVLVDEVKKQLNVIGVYEAQYAENALKLLPILLKKNKGNPIEQTMRLVFNKMKPILVNAPQPSWYSFWAQLPKIDRLDMLAEKLHLLSQDSAMYKPKSQ